MKLLTASRISLRHLRSRPFQTFSLISVIALSTALAVTLFLLARGLRQGMIRAVEPFDIIIGARGSPYQLALNTVFLRDAPIGNIEWRIYGDISDDARVSLAVPLGFGDSYGGYPIIGTTDEILLISEIQSGRPWLEISEGRWFEGEHEAVLGAAAAAESGLAMGDKFKTSHGITGAGGEHDERYEVTGVLRGVMGPYDRAIFVNIGDIWAAHEGGAESGHSGGGHEVTSVLARPVSYPAAYSLAASYQSDADAQLIFPAQTVIRLFSIMGRGEDFLSVVVRAVSGSSLLVTLLAVYWSGADRRRERELLRILGTPKGALVIIAWLEATYPIMAGAVTGEILGRACVHAAFRFIGGMTAIAPYAPLSLSEMAIPASLFAIGSLSALAVTAMDRRSGGELMLGR